MIGTYTSYKNIVSDMSRTLKTVMTQPQVKRETDYYTATIRSIGSVDKFLENDKIYSYAMQAWGLEDMAFAKGMMRKVLTDPDFAGKMVDKRYQNFAKAFDFGRYGDKATERDSATRQTVNKYMQQTLEVRTGDQNPGARLALYFNRTISEMTQGGTLSQDSWAYQIMGDKALREVVFTALSLPETLGVSDIEAQKRLLESRMSYSDLADPDKMEAFIGRFSAMYDLQNQSMVSPALDVLNATNSSSGTGFSNSMMMSLQNLRFGA